MLDRQDGYAGSSARVRPLPTAVQGSDDEKRHAFDQVFHAIRRRIELLVNLPVEKLERLALADELKRIHAQ